MKYSVSFSILWNTVLVKPITYCANICIYIWYMERETERERDRERERETERETETQKECMRVFVCVVARVRAYVAVSECVSDLNVSVKRSSRVKKNTRESRFPTRPAEKNPWFSFSGFAQTLASYKGIFHLSFLSRRSSRQEVWKVG